MPAICLPSPLDPELLKPQSRVFLLLKPQAQCQCLTHSSLFIWKKWHNLNSPFRHIFSLWPCGCPLPRLEGHLQLHQLKLSVMTGALVTILTQG